MNVKSLSREQLEQLAQSVVDALYLDIVDDSDCYNIDKEWDSDTLDLIARAVDSAGLTPE